ncbi:MAG TPA: DUF2892 domain-containing protein [Vicinamibacterales bacterium]|nr:DUF2892 domain-containing protein [Vicinamibacterales bacterium]
MALINEAGWDRVVRLIIGIVALGLWWTGTFTGALGLVALVVGVLMLLTGATGWCPMYSVFKFGTRRTT